MSKVLPTMALSRVILNVWFPLRDPHPPIDFPKYLVSLRIEVRKPWPPLSLGEKTVKNFGLKDGKQISLREKPKEMVKSLETFLVTFGINRNKYLGYLDGLGFHKF